MQPDDRHELAEIAVADRMRRAERQGRAGGRLDPRHADRVRADAEPRFQVANVLQQGQQLEPPVVEAEQHADANVVDAGLHGAVERRDAPVVVALRAAGVDAA